MSEQSLTSPREEQIKAIFEQLSGEQEFVPIGELASALYDSNLAGVKVSIIGDEESRICTIVGKPSLEIINPWEGTQQIHVPVIFEYKTRDGVTYTPTTILSTMPVQVVFPAPVGQNT